MNYSFPVFHCPLLVEGGKSGGKESFRSKAPLLLNSASLEFPQTFPGTERHNAREPESSSGFWEFFLYLLDSF